MADSRIVFDIIGRDKASQAFRDTGDSADGLRSKIGGLAKFAAGAFAGIGAASLLKGTVDAASDLNETISKSNTIFGSAAGEVDKWAKGAAKGIGQSRQQALDAAATFGNLFSQLGIGADQTAGMSRQMVELASDFASFHNADISDVLAAQTAAFRGEFDAVQRFVPTINAAAVEQKALEMGLGKTSKELDAQDKALATQALLMEGAGAAAGDFARTSGGLANKQRILSAQLQNAKATIGQALLPVVTRLTSFFADKLPGAIEKARAAFAVVSGAIRQIVSILLHRDFVGGGPFAEDSGFISGVFRARDVFVDDLLPVLRKVGAFIKTNLKPILIGLGAAFIAVTSPVTAIVAGLVLAYVRFKVFRDVIDTVATFLVRTVVPAVVKFADAVGDKIGDLVAYVQRIWPQISEAIGHVLRVVEGVVKVFVRAVSAVWGVWGDDLLRVAEAVFGTIRRVIDAALDAIRGIIQTVLAVINGDWGKAWDGLKQIVSSVWDGIKAVVGGAAAALAGILGGIWNTVTETARRAWDGFKGLARDAVDTVVRFVTDLPNRVRGLIGGIAGVFSELGGKMLEGLTKGIAGLGAGAFGLAKKAADLIGDMSRGLLNAVIRAINNMIPDSIGKVEIAGKTIFPGLNLPDNPIPLIKAARGFDGLVRSPTLFLAGEAGVEGVRITPGAPAAAARGPLVGELVQQFYGAAPDPARVGSATVRHLTALAWTLEGV